MRITEKNKWCHSEIHYILNNPLYIGHLSLYRRVSKQNGALKRIGEYPLIENHYNALVPLTLWKLAHAQLKTKAEDKSHRTRTSFLLTGIVTCASCQQMFETKNSLKKASNGVTKFRTKKGELLRYYVCPHCQRRMDPQEIESTVLTCLEQELGQQISVEGVRNKAKQLKRHVARLMQDADIELTAREHRVNEFQLDKGSFSKNLLGEDAYREILGLIRERVHELESSKEAFQEIDADLDGLLEDEELVHRLVARAQDITTALPQHELRFLILNMVEEIQVSISRSGKLTIESITYRKLPIPYLGRQIQSLSS